MTEYWIKVVSESKETDNKIGSALNACYDAHIWTLDTLKHIWERDLEIPRSSELGPELTRYILSSQARKDFYKGTARFSLNRAVEKASNEFRQKLQVVEGEVQYPDNPPKLPYLELEIPTRKIWNKYINSYGRISTHYGYLYLEDDWVDVVKQQVADIGIKEISYFTYFIYSTTIRQDEIGWSIHFHLHPPTSSLGKKAARKAKGNANKA